MQRTRRRLIAKAPRPWLTRAEGECAFPVDGKGWAARSCCNPSGGATYCPAHREALREPPGLDAEAFAEAVLAWLEGR